MHVFSWWLLAKWEIWSNNHGKKTPSGLKFNNFFLFCWRWGTLSNSFPLLWSPGRCDTLLGWVNLACSSFLITGCAVAKGIFPWCRLSSRCSFEVLAWFDWNWTVGQQLSVCKDIWTRHTASCDQVWMVPVCKGGTGALPEKRGSSSSHHLESWGKLSAALLDKPLLPYVLLQLLKVLLLVFSSQGRLHYLLTWSWAGR